MYISCWEILQWIIYYQIFVFIKDSNYNHKKTKCPNIWPRASRGLVQKQINDFANYFPVKFQNKIFFLTFPNHFPRKFWNRYFFRISQISFHKNSEIIHLFQNFPLKFKNKFFIPLLIKTLKYLLQIFRITFHENFETRYLFKISQINFHENFKMNCFSRISRKFWNKIFVPNFLQMNNIE